MKIRPGTDWATAPRTSPSCDTWRSTSCKRTRPRDLCAGSSSAPAGTTPTSPVCSPYSEVRLPCTRPRTRMPHARGVAPVRRDPPETRWLLATNDEDGRAPRIAADGNAARGNAVGLRGGACRRPDLDAVGHHAGLDVAPERDQQLSRHRHDGDPPRASLQRADALAEPCRERAVGLVAQPQPGELDERRARAWIAGAADAAVAVQTSALVRHGCDADVAGELPAVGEGAVKYLAHQYAGEVLTNTANALQGRDLLAHCVVGCCRQRLGALSFHLADLFQNQHKPAPQSVELGPQQRRQLATVTGSQFGHVALPRAQRRPSPNALREQQRLDPVLDAQLLLDEVLAFAVRSLGVLLLRRGHMHHAAHLPVTA